jgi:DNA-binding transcriptional regulator YdaS (Cro superfamily)
MDRLLQYINHLDPDAREDFARRCGTTVGYLRKAISTGQRLSEILCIRIAVESGGELLCADLRPDVDWHYYRQLCNLPEANHG